MGPGCLDPVYFPHSASTRLAASRLRIPGFSPDPPAVWLRSGSFILFRPGRPGYLPPFSGPGRVSANSFHSHSLAQLHFWLSFRAAAGLSAATPSAPASGQPFRSSSVPSVYGHPTCLRPFPAAILFAGRYSILLLALMPFAGPVYYSYFRSSLIIPPGCRASHCRIPIPVCRGYFANSGPLIARPPGHLNFINSILFAIFPLAGRRAPGRLGCLASFRVRPG